MIGTSDNKGCNVELSGLEHNEQYITEAPFVHTNHHLAKDISAGDLSENSHARLSTAGDYLSQNPSQSQDSFETLLSDTSHADHKICASYRPLLGTQIGTVCTVIMDLQKRKMRVRKGPDPEAAFDTVVELTKTA